MKNIIKLSSKANTPKYKQIVQTVQSAVEKGVLKQGDVMPSLNQIRDELNVSRDTAIKAYQELKMLGLISSSPGKGNFIAVSGQKRERNIFLLFDEFSVYKEVLYKSLQTTISNQGALELYFHHFNDRVFYDLINQSLGKYTDYVIMPLSTQASFEKFKTLFNQENVYILDQGGELYGEAFPSVYQNFKDDVYLGLKQAAGLSQKYKQMVMAIGSTKNIYRQALVDQLKTGFHRYCSEQNMQSSIPHEIDNFEIKKGMCFLLFTDVELVSLIKRMEEKRWIPGRDIGIISFNETPLKEIAGGGISTISTDFELMGRTMGEMVLNHGCDHIQNPVRLIQRNSL